MEVTKTMTNETTMTNESHLIFEPAEIYILKKLISQKNKDLVTEQDEFISFCGQKLSSYDLAFHALDRLKRLELVNLEGDILTITKKGANFSRRKP